MTFAMSSGSLSLRSSESSCSDDRYPFFRNGLRMPPKRYQTWRYQVGSSLVLRQRVTSSPVSFKARVTYRAQANIRAR